MEDAYGVASLPRRVRVRRLALYLTPKGYFAWLSLRIFTHAPVHSRRRALTFCPVPSAVLRVLLTVTLPCPTLPNP